jgi:hypothetical protein
MFETILHMCRELGLVGLGHTAIDGSKFKANASKHKAMSYGRMCETEKKLETEMAALKEQARRLLDEAERVDAEEDKIYGKGKRGDELPAELQHRESRLRKIRKAMAVVQERAKEHAARQAEEAHAKIEARKLHEEQTGRKTKAPEPKVPDPDQVEPDKKAQYNFTDPDSRIMLDGASKAFTQAYNGQIAVDADNQVIIAAALTQEANDVNQLLPMIEQIQANTGELPKKLSADAGYFSEKNLTDDRLEGIDLFVPCRRQKHGAVARSLSEKGVDPRISANPHEFCGRVYTLCTPVSCEKPAFWRSRDHSRRFAEIRGSFPRQAPRQATSPDTTVALTSEDVHDANGVGAATDEQINPQVNVNEEGPSVINPSIDHHSPVDANKPLTNPPLATPGVTLRQQMTQKLSTTDGKAVYGKRKTIVEPVFGQIKEPRGFRRFSFRGLPKASAEFKFVCAIHNLLKIFKRKCKQAAQAAASGLGLGLGLGVNPGSGFATR